MSGTTMTRVTDEMVEAFGNAFWSVNSASKIDAERENIRAALEAALSADGTQVSDLPFRVDDIKRGLILFRTSNNAHGYTNFVSLTAKVDALPQIAKDELASTMRNIARSLLAEDDVRREALEDILSERQRQVNIEGWTLEHDDQHTDGSMALAAGAYCESAARPHILARTMNAAFVVPKLWPRSWSLEWWKPKDRRRDLIRAAALIIAEIERIDRLSTPSTN